MSPVLEITGVSKSFGGIHAVNGVSFGLKEGEIVGLIGPNGAGKTTLVNLITGVHPLTSGRIVFQGEDVTRQRPFQAARRGLARTFQIVQPFPAMSVVENVAAGALFGGTGGCAIHGGQTGGKPGNGIEGIECQRFFHCGFTFSG